MACAAATADAGTDGLIAAVIGPEFGGVDHDACVQIDLTSLPDDPATLQQMLREMVAATEQQQATLQHAVQQRDAEIDKLQLLIKRLLRHQSGRRFEQLTPDQLQLGIEDLEQSIAAAEAGQDAANAAGDKPRRRPTPSPTATTARCLHTCRVTRC